MRTYHRITPAGLLSMLFGLGLLAPATTRALDLTAETETELNNAINLINGAAAGTGTHTITLTADIALTASTTTINIINGGVEIVIDGAGFTVNGQNRVGVRPFTISAGIVEINGTIITG